MDAKAFYAHFSGDDLDEVMDRIKTFTESVGRDEAHGYSFGHHTHVWTGTTHHLILSYTVWNIVPPGVGVV